MILGVTVTCCIMAIISAPGPARQMLKVRTTSYLQHTVSCAIGSFKVLEDAKKPLSAKELIILTKATEYENACDM